MKNLLTFKYWFNSNPEAFIFTAKLGILIFIGILLLAGIFFWVFRKKFPLYKKLFISLYNFSLLNFLLGALLFFFDQQRIPFFSARFWYLIWFTFMVWSLVIIFKKFKKYLINREARDREKEFKKYLP